MLGMDPITAGGLLSAGKNLLDGISNQLTSKNAVDAQGQISFPEQLGKASGQVTPSSFPDSKTARSALLEDPQVSSFMERNSSSQVYLEKRADGSVQFLASSGETLVLSKESSSCKQALNYFDLCLQEKSNLCEFRPNSVLFDA
jgi:hypothetical protein